MCLGDFGNIWEKGGFCSLGEKYPPHWEFQREILFYRKILCIIGNYVNDLPRKLFCFLPTS
jgi:hypothetical protein